MQFTSLEFLFFFMAALFLNTFLKGKVKKAVIILFSLYFAAVISEAAVVVLMMLVAVYTLLNKVYARLKTPSSRKNLVIFSLTVIILNLLVFKYYSVISGFVTDLFGLNLQTSVDKLVPIGISYFSFMLIAYFLDVYYERIKPEQNALNFIFYIVYFPKLISGPIERGSSFLPQLQEEKKLDYKLFMEGLRIFIWGYFLKSVIADRLAYPVDKVFASPSEFSSYQVLLGIIFFSFQLYADFGGYSYMAIGVSAMLGIRLTNNFRTPFFSKSVSDFWTRWHITLSSWLRDYIFLPLSINVKRKDNGFWKLINGDRTVYVISTLITMSLCGIWHGPKFTFFIWGFLHGLYLSASFVTKKIRLRLLKKTGLYNNNVFLPAIRSLFIFVLVVFAFVFFKAETLRGAYDVFAGLAGPFDISIGRLFLIKQEIYIAISAILFMLFMDYLLFKRRKIDDEAGIQNFITIPVLISLIVLIFLFGKFNTTDFIYFRF